jgi:hypothetical protein
MFGHEVFNSIATRAFLPVLGSGMSRSLVRRTWIASNIDRREMGSDAVMLTQYGLDGGEWGGEVRICSIQER